MYQQAYETIKKTILSGQLPPGSKLITTKLAEQYQISRTPLREALRQLQIEGLIISTQSSLEVVTLNMEDFKQLSHCRLVLEKDIIVCVIESITNEKLQEIEEIVKEADEACDAGDNLRLLELNTLFHSALHECCSNKRIVQLLDQVRSLLLIYRANSLMNYETNKEVVEEHRALLQAVKQKDAEIALKAVAEHLENDTRRGTTVIK